MPCVSVSGGKLILCGVREPTDGTDALNRIRCLCRLYAMTVDGVATKIHVPAGTEMLLAAKMRKILEAGEHWGDDGFAEKLEEFEDNGFRATHPKIRGLEVVFDAQELAIE